MRESEFWSAVEWTFPDGRGTSLTQDLVLFELGNKSPAQALDEGVNPQRVWDASQLGRGLFYYEGEVIPSFLQIVT